MKEDKSVFLKVDRVEPVYKGCGICSREEYLDGVRVWIGAYGYFFPCDRYTVCDPDAAREDGILQARDLVIELIDMNLVVKQELFGVMNVNDILLHFPYEDIKKKLDAWKNERPKGKIRVRDEVVNLKTGCKMVVTVPPKMHSNSVEYMSGIDKSGKVYKDMVAAAYKKTGLHVDDLDSYLEV